MIQVIHDQSFLQYLKEQNLVDAYQTARRTFGGGCVDHRYLAQLLDIPDSLCFALENLCRKQKDPPPAALDSISLFSLLKGLYLPLSSMVPAKVAQLFRLRWQESGENSGELMKTFLAKDLGLTLTEKIAYLMGDPFCGQNSRTGQDTLFQVLSTIRLASPRQLRDRLGKVGDIGVLLVDEVEKIRSDPPITAREALFILDGIPHVGSNRKKEVLCDLFQRAGRLERYFLARMLLRRLNFGYEFRRQAVVRALSGCCNASEATIENAIALADIFEVARILEKEGEDGLEKLVLKPLNPFSPALAGNAGVEKNTAFPLWIECKYDGIRLMAHKETGAGRVKYAAFTRRKYDWLELVASLEISLNYIPARSFIIDGELHGKIGDWEGKGWRQATVYEIYRHLQGDTGEVVRLQYVAFDILYFNGQDLTKLPFLKRRKMLEQVMAPAVQLKLTLPITLSEGWEVHDYQESQKWYRYFRNQGQEGIIAKVPDSPYSLGKRTDDWRKKKEAVYLDLAITGALWSVSEYGPRTFSAYILSVRDGQELRPIGRAQGLDRQSNLEIVQRIAMEGLLTGKVVEMRTSSGTHPGVELLPSIIATVRFEGITRDSGGEFSLRDPKIVYIRPRGDAGLADIDTCQSIRELYMKMRLK